MKSYEVIFNLFSTTVVKLSVLRIKPYFWYTCDPKSNDKHIRVASCEKVKLEY